MPLLARPKVLVFAGSIRSGALSQKVADVAAKEIALLDAEVTKISLGDYPLPIYNGDLEKEKGIPENALKLGRLLAAHQGVFVSTPEYNNSVPPLLKNTIDWVSRIRPDQHGIKYRHRVFGVGGSSDGFIGGARALIDCRKILQSGWGAILIPEKIEVSRAQDAFNESGEFVAEAPSKLMKNLARSLVTLAQRLAD